MTLLRRPHSRGITLVETCLSTVIVGGLLAASITAVGNLSTARQITADHARGFQLAEDLLSEAQMLPYMDPTLSEDQIGPPAAELVPGNRSLFNDCDDYSNWSEAPLQDKGGTVLAGFDGWKRTIRVQWVNPSAGFATSATSTVQTLAVTRHHLGESASFHDAARHGTDRMADQSKPASWQDRVLLHSLPAQRSTGLD